MTARVELPVADYNLDLTLDSGQVFRWRREGAAWCGVIGARWVRLESQPGQLIATTNAPAGDWTWLTHFLQTGDDIAAVCATFPDDEPMRAAVNACRGLRLLRQDPWECLASFILSSTKQIVQIRQIVEVLCERFGDDLPVPPGAAPWKTFPTAERLAACTEAELRACKMGFRAPYLLAAARRVAAGELNLEQLATLDCALAREQLMKLPGVGRKIADCVLLFAYGFQEAFPVDVWVLKALQQLYFLKRRASTKRLQRFAATHFGPNAGYAQQYLFHYMRTVHPRGPQAVKPRRRSRSKHDSAESHGGN
jgi:N-glycosylase/DNA lyase